MNVIEFVSREWYEARSRRSRGLCRGIIVPRVGSSCPDHYGTVYAVDAASRAWVLDRIGPPDQSKVEWRIRVVEPGTSKSEWVETYATKREAVDRIRREVEDA